jgi:glycosyltransferase involved in cell wall biosynthesis
VGGLFRHVRDLSREQARRGHSVGVVCDAAVGDRLTEAQLGALEAHLRLGLARVPMSRELGLRDLSAYLSIRRRAAGLSLDVIHGHGAKGGAYSRLVARALKRAGAAVASCYTPHGGSLHYHPGTLAGGIYMHLERNLAGATDALIFESGYSAARYADQVGRHACAARVIPNGLGLEDFAHIEAAAGAADFLFVGELRRLKGVDVMLDALARVRRTRAVRAVIVGSGPDAGAFRTRAAKLGLEAAVSFLGPMPAREAFRLGRVLVVPSRAESFPYIVLEAAAAALPLIATSVGGIPEIVAGTDAGLLPPEDADRLAKAMLGMLDDPAAAQVRAMQLQRAVAGRFTIAAMTSEVLDLYATVLADSRTPPKT